MMLPEEVVAVIQKKYPFVVNVLHYFPIEPCPAPRMTRRDAKFTDPNHPDPKKRQRECVTRYFAFKNTFQWLCKQQHCQLSHTNHLLFVLPMAKSLSLKKKTQMVFGPCQQRPDKDNMEKAVLDSFGVEDGYVWDGRTTKIWGWQPAIIIYETYDCLAPQELRRHLNDWLESNNF